MRLRILEPIDAGQRTVVHDALTEATRPGRDYLFLVVLSCVIASFGLVLNSAAVIIGAMLIAPLMSAILALALALVEGDVRRFGRALGTLVLGVGVALTISALLGTLVSLGGLNLLEDLPPEIVSRTQPTLFDLAIALAGGAAGAYALTQPKLSGTLPGVAIATALMPPLCVAGIGLSQERLDVSSGALLLFIANFVAIVFASSLVFTGVGFRAATLASTQGRFSPALLLSSVLILLVALPLAGFLIRIAQDAHDNVTIRASLITALGPQGGRLVSFEKTGLGDDLQIVATVRVPHPLTFTEGLEIQGDIAKSLQRRVALKFIMIPITILDPLAPPPASPTATRTPPPGRTATPTPLP